MMAVLEKIRFYNNTIRKYEKLFLKKLIGDNQSFRIHSISWSSIGVDITLYLIDRKEDDPRKFTSHMKIEDFKRWLDDIKLYCFIAGDENN